ncbi:CPBP family intramembrane metalloprotease [Sulfidibacter corallicola]|uniref:CPBP family intramembrane metalloprotease n=1 Tax=Sulfidibacter corallicola TaxID=2818388 RepID=A0A8A4TN70_SULCO|nr:CPBP family glutamic-type intramembrane protease [Sulfidibacter corallicola]QTD51439.1 CPBP family intramembrane metalloprotease [Sulfidibacter corallicola]
MAYSLIRASYYRNLLREFTAFLRNPHLTPSPKSTKAKITDTVGLFILKIFFLIGLGLFFALLSPIYDPENLTKSNMAERFSPIILILVGGFILPLLEETLFRLSLRFNPGYLALTSSVASYYVLTKLVYNTSLSAVDESLVVRVGISICACALIYPILRIESIGSALANFWRRYFRWIFYGTCLFFAWIHISNYESSLVNLLMMPIITLPQLSSALIYGYTRVAFGFQYPLLLHFSNNLIAMVITLL